MSLLSIIARHAKSNGTIVPEPEANTLRARLQPHGGTLKLEPTGTIGVGESQVIETSFFKDDDGLIKMYHTSCRWGDSGGINDDGFHNDIALATMSSMDSTWTRYGNGHIIGEGQGGAPIGRRAHCSCVHKGDDGKVYAYATNGYGWNYPGEDRNIYGYVSDDGYTFTDMGKTFDKTQFPNIVGYGNMSMVVDKHNRIVKFNGKYVMLVEAYTNLNRWEIHYAESDAKNGPWLITEKLLSLKADNGMYGGSWVIYNGGKLHCFYHYGTVSGVPTNIAYATSLDAKNWTVVEAPVITYYDADPTPPIPPATANFPYEKVDQAADPAVVEIDGVTYLTAEFVQNDPRLAGQIRMWKFNGTFEEFVSGLTLPQ